MSDSPIRNALVTGSSSGIGEAIAKKLAQLNYKLVITGRNEPDIGRVADECESLSPSKLKPLQIRADLSEESEVELLFQSSLEFFENRLHLLVNNAGYGEPVAPNKPDQCYQAYKRIMQINLNSIVRLTLLAAPHLKATSIRDGLNQAGSIVNVGSIASFRPSMTLASYATSKAGLNMFAQSMAVELAPEIRVNIVSPGPIETKIIERSGYKMDDLKALTNQFSPLKRVGQADEVAESVVFLADPARAAFITGANLIVDGGSLLATLG